MTEEFDFDFELFLKKRSELYWKQLKETGLITSFEPYKNREMFKTVFENEKIQKKLGKRKSILTNFKNK